MIMGLQQGVIVEEHTSFMWDFVRQCGGYAVVDGGFATELERHGQDLNDPLWSAKCLIDAPHLVRRVHLEYLEAGANIIISGSYQGTIEGFEAKGLSKEGAEYLLRRSVQIAGEARDIYRNDRKCMNGGSIADDYFLLQHQHDSSTSTPPPVLIAASVGSYGAYLSDGSEYTGDYGESVTLDTLKDFHRRRLQVLTTSGPDLIAFETIPNKLEAQAYVELLAEQGLGVPAWLSFSCKDETHVVSGDSISECAALAHSCNQVVAVGVNCTPPRFISRLILSIKKVTDKPIIVYPNSGETYDALEKQWVKSCGVQDEGFVSYVATWREAGASLFGGCCRTTPATIKAISRHLLGQKSSVN